MIREWFMTLSNDIIIAIVSNWLQIFDVSCLDNAICNHTERIVWNEIFTNSNLPLSQSVVTNACIRRMITQLRNSIFIDCNAIDTNMTGSMWYMQYDFKYCSNPEHVDILYVSNVIGNKLLDKNHNSHYHRDSYLIPIMCEVIRLSPNITDLHVHLSGPSVNLFVDLATSKRAEYFPQNLTSLYIHVHTQLTEDCSKSIISMISLATQLENVDLTFGNNADQVMVALTSCTALSTVTLNCQSFQRTELLCFNKFITNNNTLCVCILRAENLSFEYIQASKKKTVCEIESELSCDQYWKTRQCAWSFLKHQHANARDSNSPDSYIHSYIHFSHFHRVSTIEMFLKEPVQITYLHIDGIVDHILRTESNSTVIGIATKTKIERLFNLATRKDDVNYKSKAVKFDLSGNWIYI